MFRNLKQFHQNWTGAHMPHKRLVILTALLSALTMGSAVAADKHPVKDSFITTKVKSQLVGDFGTRARHISVKTKDGVVALTGRVESADDKDNAEQDAEGVKGVVDVIK